MSLADIKARAAAATPGPWEAIEHVGSEPAMSSVWTTEDGEHDVCLAEETLLADAEFVAHARTDIDRLLAVAEAATAVLEDAKEMRAIVEELATLLGRPDLAARDAKPDAPLRRLRAALAALDAL